MKKLLIICGPTATGKTGLGLKIAKKFNGEIVAADSRQVYQGMDLATGKDIQKGKWLKDHWEIEKIPVWLLDVVQPNQEFSVAHYVKMSWPIIKKIWQKNKLPILVGGTGFYLKAMVEDVPTKEIPPNWVLRKQLEKKSIKVLFNELAELDSFRAAQMNLSDRQNKRRLIRAIEIARWQVGNRDWQPKKPPMMKILMIGLKAPLPKIYQMIDQRVEEQFKSGAEEEVRKLRERGFSWELPSMSAMGYREWRPFFEGKSSRGEVLKRWQFNEHGYARRQMTWFKKNPQVHWFDITQKGWENKVEEEVFIWYTKDHAKKN
ncbi:tRNA (adenosine(37)-N6)-dimethylallyltransferase MiaA [Candidatus Shapirobacteria bacterium]|nr:tRNA (adenosine(37)-N6)-dimethylallyltransferase MiaA [Candidatus Shapirobacteria bacterium]